VRKANAGGVHAMYPRMCPKNRQSGPVSLERGWSK